MKVEGVYQGFVFLGLLFIATATFLYVCLLGYCGEEWRAFNLIFSLFAEILIFIWMAVFVNKGIDELKVNEPPKKVANLCDELRACALVAMGYSVIQLFFPDVDTSLSIIYGANIFLVASFFFVWMTVKKNNIERRGTMCYFY